MVFLRREVVPVVVVWRSLVLLVFVVALGRSLVLVIVVDIYFVLVVCKVFVFVFFAFVSVLVLGFMFMLVVDRSLAHDWGERDMILVEKVMELGIVNCVVIVEVESVGVVGGGDEVTIRLVVVNGHVDDYRDNISVPNRRISSWGTIDASLTRRWGDGDGGADITLSIQNLTDEPAPFVNNTIGVGFDAANASLLGRFVAVEVRHRW